jgi:hypothetical protein
MAAAQTNCIHRGDDIEAVFPPQIDGIDLQRFIGIDQLSEKSFCCGIGRG